ncbi:hypothetical protein V1477_012661 [Vespula maculifrons]|uniref:Uncharacterized protein n=1 Tax=Vespula maculifrons TaxID=7453 RepID=A0ABD2BTP1_VESMC
MDPIKTRVRNSSSTFRTQPFARKYLPLVRFEYLTSTADPGPTAWRLLHLETRGLTVTLLFTTTLLSRKQSNGATSTPDEFKPPNAKIAAPCVSAFGNRLTHSSTIQHRKLRSPLEHDRLCFRDKRRNPKLNLPQSRYLREHSGNTHANMLNTTPTPLPADISECPSILPEREKRNPSTPEVERFFKHPYKNLSPSMILGR